MTGFLSSLLSDYQRQIERYRNRPFLQSVMAACALVATANGEVSFSERIRVDQIFSAIGALKVFDPHDAVNLFNEYAEKILRQPKEGHKEVVEILKTIADDSEKAALIMRILLAVCEAGDGSPLVKQIEVVVLCSELGIDPSDCGLYVDDLAQ